MNRVALKLFGVVVMLLGGTQLDAQQATSASSADAIGVNLENPMLLPPPVSGQEYPVSLSSEEHANTLTYGLGISTGHSDNVLGASYGYPVSDINYSVWPTIGLDATTSRLHWEATYAPGFTFYQRTSARNQADQNAVLGLRYRLSPHVTISARDTLQKSSSIFNQPNWAAGSVSGATDAPNNSLIAPLADRLLNFGSGGITYQYSANDMIGAGGSFSYSYYQNKEQVPGLSDSSTQSGSGFYTHRLSSRHYFGIAYQYQRFMTYPTEGFARTQTDSGFLFYTFNPANHWSVSIFAGPQHSKTVQPAFASSQLAASSSREWHPAAGASLGWESRVIAGAVSYSHAASGGSGLFGAVQLDSANAGLRAQLTRSTRMSVSGFYGNSRGLEQIAGMNNGHSISGTIALERIFGARFMAQAGYTRLHQTYGIPVIAGAPDTNREFVSFSYIFTRPWGR